MSSISKIAILTGASLAWNPRAIKEATTLAHAGFDVIVYGSGTDRNRLEVDQALARRNGFAFESVESSLKINLVHELCSMWRRICARVGRETFKFLRIESHWQFGPAIARLCRQANAANADYYIAHLEQGAWVGAKLMRQGRRVGIDMEDWYSEDLPPQARKSRPIVSLRALERQLLQQGAHSTCPSDAMSVALAREYACNPPAVIYNVFPWSDRTLIDGLSKDKSDSRILSIHWYSQTIGPGRGLEDLLAALPRLEHRAEIHLRGNPVSGFAEWFADHVPETWRSYVFVHDLVPNEELLSRIAEHDIGFAGEMKYCKSRDLTITNKILHYLLAGLAVVASDTAGQQEVAVKARGAVFLYPSGDPMALSHRLNALLESKERLQLAKTAALQAAEQTFCWERQESALLGTVRRALGSIS
ncbi:MAG: glycosyltransferase [Burkholderiales bacterium]|nr:glycosyltransferase [Burkholderiales bacterium]